MVTLGVYIYVFKLHVDFLRDENAGLSVTDEPTEELQYIEAYSTHNGKNEINMQFYIGVIVLLSYAKQLCALMVTEILGPIITTIMYMFADIKTFIVIWVIVLVMFTAVGILGFQEVVAIKTFGDGFIFWIQAALGDWDISVFDVYDESELNQPVKHKMGIYFTLIYVFINILVLLNVVIAMMADTYALMTSVRKGLYNYNIIKSASSYQTDKYYGGLLLLTAPFSIIGFFLIPFYCCIKDKKRLERFNTRFYLFCHVCFYIPLSCIFVGLNLLMVPFAYLKTCIHKVNLFRQGIVSFVSCLAYVVIGLPILLYAQMTDLWAFFKASFSRKKEISQDDIFVIEHFYFTCF